MKAVTCLQMAEEDRVLFAKIYSAGKVEDRIFCPPLRWGSQFQIHSIVDKKLPHPIFQGGETVTEYSHRTLGRLTGRRLKSSE